MTRAAFLALFLALPGCDLWPGGPYQSDTAPPPARPGTACEIAGCPKPKPQDCRTVANGNTPEGIRKGECP